jgi:hypothetical protein
MAKARFLLAAPLAFQLFAPTALYAQAEPPPTAAESPAAEVPLMQLEAPADRVIAPPPVNSPPPPAVAAELPPPEPAPPPACDQSATPSPCTQPSDAYRHDGFYFRLMNETQYFAVLGEGPDGSASVKGLGSGGTLALGGTPLPGLVIGGMMNATTLRGNFKGRPEGPETDASVSRVMFGAFADWFPDPYDGWHVGAALGFAAVTLTDSSLDDAEAQHSRQSSSAATTGGSARNGPSALPPCSQPPHPPHSSSTTATKEATASTRYPQA